MTKSLFWVAFGACLAVGIAFRVGRLDARPMHHDEANQAVRFGTLLEGGQYRYDPADHHGPTLYYVTLPAAWLRGQHTLAALDERTLRIVPAVFGVAVILLFSLLSRDLGRGAVTSGALLAAVSPALTYYSRFYIQESLFIFFVVGFVISLGKHATQPRVGWVLAAGIFAGLAYATKETFVIVLATAGAACVATRLLAGNGFKTDGRTFGRLSHLALAVAAAFAVAFLFYSSFFANPWGIAASVTGLPGYVARGVEAGGHAEPWYYYLGLLAWSPSGGLVWTEGLLLVLALAGAIFAVRRARAGFWPLYLSLYSVTTAAVFSAVSYKTPWNVLPFHVVLALLAGFGAASIMAAVRSRALRTVLVVLFAVATVQLVGQALRANFTYPADPRNPYAYAQTSMDFMRLVKRVSDVATIHADGRAMLVKVVAGPYEQWPLPWYFRGMTRVGYWPNARDAGVLDGTPVIVASQQNSTAVETAVGNRYVSEFYGLRPGVLLTLYIERLLWERLLAQRAHEGAIRDR